MGGDDSDGELVAIHGVKRIVPEEIEAKLQILYEESAGSNHCHDM